MALSRSLVERDLLQALADEASGARTSSAVVPAHADASLVASLWQKAIRRGHDDWAITAALELQRRDPEYVWRRIRVIALEEVSVANLPLVAQVLAIAGKRVLRAKLGERLLLSHLTRELTHSRKCRTPCDMASWLDPMGEGPEERRLPGRVDDFASGDLTLIRQSATAWRDAVPLSMRVDGQWKSSGKGSGARRDAYLKWVDASPLLQFVVERGGSTYALNALCVPAAQLKALHCAPRLAAMPPPCSDDLVRGIPAYAYCMYSAPGREALRLFLRRSGWAADERIPMQREALNVFGNLVFYVEGGYCADMLEVAHGSAIERASEQVLLARLGIRPLDVPALMNSARAALPLLNATRRLVAQGH